ncbi:hypothetical protein HDU97_002465 [Phlyctochytrium planicorne]|nr:hypothetical protein HDU97_002465 [Phlyctochytrium planicorne]
MTDAEASSSAIVIDKVPEDQINLRLLLVSGKKSDILVLPTDGVDTVKQKIFTTWPKEWSEETPESPASLRLLHRGKFLEGNSTLDSHSIPVGQTTTVHLLIKNGQPEPASPDKPTPVKESAGCSCIIL